MTSRPYYPHMSDEVRDLSTHFERLALNYTYQKGAAQLAGPHTPSICACDCKCQSCMCRPRSGVVESTRVGFGGHDTGQLAALQRQLEELGARFTFSTSNSSRGGPTFSTVGPSSVASSATPSSLEEHRRMHAHQNRHDLAQLSIDRYNDEVDQAPWRYFVEQSVVSGQSPPSSPMLHGEMDITDSMQIHPTTAHEELLSWSDNFARDSGPIDLTSQGTGSGFFPAPRVGSMITPLLLTPDCRHARHRGLCDQCANRRRRT